MNVFPKARYIFRLDDIHPEMNWEKFERIKKIFDRFGVKPIIAVIPHNCDELLKKNSAKQDFWPYIKDLEHKGWEIAMHGYDHGYVNRNGGIINLNKYGEFAGLSYSDQQEKIKKGKKVFLEHVLPLNNFIAPAHSFDKTTCRVLKEEGFQIISDGIALFPFRKYGLIWVPQIAWRPREFSTGIITFCFHTDNCLEQDFKHLESFLEKNKDQVISFSDAVVHVDDKYSRLLLLLNWVINIVFYTRRIIYRLYKRPKKMRLLREEEYKKHEPTT